MSVKVFLLIETEIEAAKTAEVAVALKRLGREVKSVDCVTGPYDIIATVEVDTIDQINHLVTGQIHSVPGVHRTVTCLAVQ